MQRDLSFSERFAPILPLLKQIGAAADTEQLHRAALDAMKTLGMDQFVFTTADPSTPCMLCDPLLGHKQSSVAGVLAREVCCNHKSWGGTDGAGVTHGKHPSLVPGIHPPTQPFFGPLSGGGAKGFACTPVLSLTDGPTVFVTFSHTRVPDAAILPPQELLGTAISLRLAALAIPDSPPASGITDVQEVVLGWIAQGKSNNDIAQIMGMSRRTCNYHVSEIIRKLNVASRTQAVDVWRRQ